VREREKEREREKGGEVERRVRDGREGGKERWMHMLVPSDRVAATSTPSATTVTI
jgi:hypothetical protein